MASAHGGVVKLHICAVSWVLVTRRFRLGFSLKLYIYGGGLGVLFYMRIIFHAFGRFVLKDVDVGGWLSHHKVNRRIQSWGTEMSN